MLARRELTAPSRKTGEEWERGKPEIDVRSGRVFVGSSDHGLYALRSGDGSTLWRFETAGVVQSEPYYDAELDTVYFGSHDGALYAVRAFDGSLVYRFDTGAEVARRPVRLGETLYVTNGADHLFALDRRTGKARWQAKRPSALGMEIAGHAGPSTDGALVFTAFSDGTVAAYDARDGAERWTTDLSADAEATAGTAPRYLDTDTTPVVDELPGQGRVIYAASYGGGVVALEAATGQRVWSNAGILGVTDVLLLKEPAHAPSRHSSEPGPEVPPFSILVAAGAQSGLVGLDPVSGHELWRLALPEGGLTQPVPVMGALLLGTTRYGAFLVSPRNGKVIDGLDLGSGFAHTPAAYGSRAFVLTNAGTFLSLAVESPRAHELPSRAAATRAPF